MKVSLLIAVEEYADAQLPPVKFAAADAEAMAKALEPHGFEAADRMLLLQGQATRTTVESRLRRALRAAADDDVVCLYFAGVGFSLNGRNFLACHDTQSGDLEATSIALDWLLDLLADCEAESVVLLLDATPLVPPDAAPDQAGTDDLLDEELAAFFEQQQRCVCLAARQTGEVSWPNRQQKHGAWANHLLEAWSGTATGALAGGALLTAASLQRYLEGAVPRSLRAAFTDRKQQTPTLYAKAGVDFPLADFRDIPPDAAASSRPSAQQMLRVRLVRQKSHPVKELAGFRSHHRVPDSAGHFADSFVSSLAEEQIRADLEQIHLQLRTAFRFKRLDVQMNGPVDGGGSLITPFFTYAVSVISDPDDPGSVIWQWEVMDMKESEPIFSDAFAQVFGDLFDTIEFTPSQSVELTDFIDRVEQLDEERIQINYDPAATWCELEIINIAGLVHITPSIVQIVQRHPQPPRLLLQSFLDIQHILIDANAHSLLPFHGKQ
ncbi:caspase family protein [Lignipirellula cremea]|uniref:Caspase domain protein n=1 Tax=Lignipirellula cremea TaxID=2528010 RepID=A0A518E067_9BACT|nr:caspase family protein [Lignipirellula cremea]QDU97490.1 Caspase domain protein [Lignipirellula cremea]